MALNGDGCYFAKNSERLQRETQENTYLRIAENHCPTLQKQMAI